MSVELQGKLSAVTSHSSKPKGHPTQNHKQRRANQADQLNQNNQTTAIHIDTPHLDDQPNQTTAIHIDTPHLDDQPTVAIQSNNRSINLQPHHSSRQMANGQCSGCLSICRNMSDAMRVILCVLGLIGILLICILVPLSVQTINWDRIGFKKNTLNNEIDTGTVYENGRYFWGLSAEAYTFNALYSEEIVVLSIAASNGQEFNIHNTFYWRVQKRNLAKILSRFGKNIRNQVINRANSAIKNVAPSFTINEYIQNRTTIPDVLHASLSVELGKIWVDVPREGFHLHRVDIPDQISELNLHNAIQIQTNLKRQNEQQAASVRAETNRLTKEIETNTTLVELQTDSTVVRMKREAQANAARIIASADGRGIEELFNQNNITDDATRRKYFEFFVLINVLSPASVLSDVFK